MPVVAIIGDLAGSRKAAQRAALQRRLARALESASAGNATLASPYTLTLGDEFQAVYRRADRVVLDLLRLMEAIHPVRVRFALGVGTLTTALNPVQALGMDGPAFHRARAVMDELKQRPPAWQIGGEPPAGWAPINHVLRYLGHHMRGWDANRLAILRRRIQGVTAADMAAELGISKVAIHKNIRVAALDDVVAICQDITAALVQALADA